LSGDAIGHRTHRMDGLGGFVCATGASVVEDRLPVLAGVKVGGVSRET
jgi:hypothetical protein